MSHRSRTRIAEGVRMDRPEAVSVIWRLVQRRDVRRVELAYAGFIAAEFGTWVAILVYAYDHGGATAAALAALAQLVPASGAAPLLSGLVDRRGGAAVLRLGYLCQAAGFSATAALILTSAPPPLAYATAIITACAVTMTRPAQAALIPSLVRDADELTAMNTLSGWSEAISDLVGTALAGALIATGGAGMAIAWFALVLIGSATLIATVSTGQAPVVADAEDASDVRGGVIALRDDPGLAGVVAVLGAEYLVIGVLDVLLVVLAIGVLEMGQSGAGYLSAAFGAGGILGSVAALSLIGRRRLASPLIAAAVGWAALMVALGAWPTVGGAFLLLAIAGAARTVVEVAGRTMLLRGAPAAVRGRVFGLLEGVSMLGLALGALLVLGMVSLAGAGLALVATGGLLTAVTLAAAAWVHRADRSAPATVR
jgi:predicted MFS family arabinose efflux permease